MLGGTDGTTHRRQEEDCLREDKDIFRTTFENAAVGMAHISLDGHFMRINRRFCEITGYSREELSASTFMAITHPDDLASDIFQSQKLLKGEIPSYQMQKRYLHRDGHVVWCLLTRALEMDQEGRPLCYTAVIQDISGLREAEAALERQRELLKRIIDTIPVMITIYDPNLRTFQFNNEFRKVLGWSEGDLIDSDPMEIFYPDPEYREMVRRYMQSLEPGWRDIIVRSKGGASVESFWANIRLSDDTQVGIGIDLRQRRKAEADLRESEERFRNMADHSPVVIWVADSEGNCIYINPTWEEMTGQPVFEGLGRGWLEKVHAGDRDRGRSLFTSAMEVRRAFRMEYRVRHRDGSWRWVLDSAVPRFSPSGEFAGYIGSVIDISDRKSLEEELRTAKDSAEDASRAKSEFLANMSHEIRTPMTVVLAALEHLAEQESSPEQETFIEMAQTSAERLHHLIDDILDLSKIEARRMEIVDEPYPLRQTVEKIVRLFSLQARQKGLKLRLRTDEDLPELVRGDPDRLEQILTNLIGNALKFTSAGGIEVKVAKAPEGLLFTVTDTGIGIPAEKEGLLFGSFTQLDSSRSKKFGGTGLGLAISRGLVDLMGGRIWVESTEGKGSVFSFVLPLVPADCGEIAPEDKIAGLQRHGYRKILLVEDDPMVRDLVEMMLRKKKWDVVKAESGEKAIQLFDSEKVDLILMDLQMPGMDGLDATRRIRLREEKIGRRTPIIALTAYVRREDELECIAAGMDGYLSKPIRTERLYAAVNAQFEVQNDCSGSPEKE